MERLTERFAGKYIAINGCGTVYKDAERKRAPVANAIVRLAAYEDAMPLERAQELAQAEKDGRLVVLPETSVLDRKSFVDGLRDYFQEASYCDISVGIFGMSEGEKKLASALINALTSEEAEAALKKREGRR